ncbi:MAG: hypothetical protein K0M78_08485 [Brevundimonas sp.]|nr:hypothetical protein [Brevundimonas sp.]
MQVQGPIEVGEAAAYGGRASSRLGGGPLAFLVGILLTLSAFLAIYLLFTVADLLFGFPDAIFELAPFAIALGALVVGWNLARRFALRRCRKAYADRGLISPVGTSFEIAEEALVVVTGRLRLEAPWSAVSDLFAAGPYWIVLLEGSAQFLPRRFFASPSEERAFLSELLVRMSPEARARSRDAEAFAGGSQEVVGDR